MNDKTLLELAAKASGYGLCIDNAGNRFTNFPDKTGWQTMVPWNPLTDDGDALRLAVKLKLHIGLEDHAVSAWDKNQFKNFQSEKFTHQDEGTATRRAIVRAAAAIAEQGEKE